MLFFMLFVHLIDAGKGIGDGFCEHFREKHFLR